MSAGLLIRATLQAIVFLIIAHVLGAKGYGAFSATMALANVLASFVGLGSQTLLVRNVAHDISSFTDNWRSTLASLIISIPVFFLIYLIISWLVLPSSIPSFVILVIGLAELVFSPVIFCTIAVYRGAERIGRASKIFIFQTFVRLLAAIILVFFAAYLPSNQWLPIWITLYAVAQLFSFCYSLHTIKNDYGLPMIPNWSHFFLDLRSGLGFAFSNVALRLYADIDKAMLARMISLESSGIYAAAYRIIDMITLPIHGMLQAAQANIFRAGRNNNTLSAFSYVMRILPFPFIYALAACTLVFLSADLLTFLLGEDYSETVEVLYLLAGLPLASLVRLLSQSSLLSSGQHKNTVTIIILGAICNILLNLWLIPFMNWRGAVLATYLSEGFMTISMLLIIIQTKLSRT